MVECALGPKCSRAAAGKGIEFLRLHPDSMRPAQRDFLIGDAESDHGHDRGGSRQLRLVLDGAGKAWGENGAWRMMAACPVYRAKKDVSDASDGRIWRQENTRAGICVLARPCAAWLRNHLVDRRYNPLDGPHPDREFGFEDPDDLSFREVVGRHPRNAGRSFLRLQSEDGKIESAKPIQTPPSSWIGWFYADRKGVFPQRGRIDNRALSPHLRNPRHVTTHDVPYQKGRFAYPAVMPAGKGRTAVSEHR